MKEEALKLADESLRENTQVSVESAYMIRRLVEELDNNKLRNSDNPFAKALRNAEALKIKPLSDEEIYNCMNEILPTIMNNISNNDLVNFARKIEERHGIK